MKGTAQVPPNLRHCFALIKNSSHLKLMNKKIAEKIIERYGLEVLPSVSEETAHDFSRSIKDFLAVFGCDPDDEQNLSHYLQEIDDRYWNTIVDPVIVNQEGDSLRLELRLPEETQNSTLFWTVIEENSTEHHNSISVVDLPVSDRQSNGNRSYIIVDLEISLSLAAGYHRLLFHSDNNGKSADKKAVCRLIVTPGTCYLPRGLQDESRVWGLSCNLDTLRTRSGWGIGTFSDLKTILCWGAENGAALVAANPLQALHFRLTDKRSQWQRISRCFLSPLYLDIEAMTDFSECGEAQDFIHDPSFQMTLAELREQNETDYNAIEDVKLTVLNILWQHFQDNHLNPETDRGRQFREFQHNNGDPLFQWSAFAAMQLYFKNEQSGIDQEQQKQPMALRFPGSQEIDAFVRDHLQDVAFQQYIQWQADMQLQAVGRRSMELGLKVGLLTALPHYSELSFFEQWYGEEFFGNSNALPLNMKEWAYDGLIAALRSIMGYAGAIHLNIELLLEHQYLLPAVFHEDKKLRLRYPIKEVLSVIALESQRNRCMVICDYAVGCVENLKKLLIEKQFFLSRFGSFTASDDGSWLAPEDYPKHAAVAAGSDTTSLHDFWTGKDLACTLNGQSEDSRSRREEMIVSRAADRAHLLIMLQREGLLPHGYDVDPVTVPGMTPELTAAVHFFLLKSAACIFLLQLENIPVLQDKISTDAAQGENILLPYKLPVNLETVLADKDVRRLLESFSQERGIGVVKPSVVLRDRHTDKRAAIPRAFYRMQLNKEFSFACATEIIPYLDALGISHCYTSPYLQARPGSSHGYDIIDHSSINTEIGSREEYEEFVAALGRHNMAQIFDMVPNHMGAGSDNKWWMDVLENGQSSLYADFFDINWQPQQAELKDRILLPVLGSYYGNALEDGSLCLTFEAEKGIFQVTYFEHCFPVAPDAYPFILSHNLKRLEDRLGPQHEGFHEFQSLITSLINLSTQHVADMEQIRMRHRNKEVLKRLLARLCREVSALPIFIEENVALFNGKKGHPESFDLLHQLLDQQAYRLAFWRVASDEINYRRFFDINDLAGIRIEESRVFEKTHNLVLDLIATGKIDGLRIDHPDGLYNPAEYFQRLQKAISGSSSMILNLPSEGKLIQKNQLPFYIVVEKILADFEHLRDDWLVHGTTGYDFAAVLNGLFVDSTTEKQMTLLYYKFIGEKLNPDLQIYNAKKLIIQTAMAGELNVLAGELHRIAKRNRYTRDLTLNGLRTALIEIIAFFPVYRTYISDEKIDPNERNYVEWAVAKAKKIHQAEDPLIYDFIETTLLLGTGTDNNSYLKESVNFAMKLQQYTGPIMAKGLEDTFCYIYNRLLSLNDVGADPRRYGVSAAAFHHANSERLKYWPHAMLNTSTHDSKRSEDVRARINILSEMATEWQDVLSIWSRVNRGYKTKIDSGSAPSKNDEYAFYQNLLGIWPLDETDSSARNKISDRMTDYMLKAIREAKVHTSWINQDLAYETAMETFVRGCLTEENNTFIESFIPFEKKIAWFGMLNSLSQLLLKLTSPGVPDIYQGNEVWHFRLVDPDNRQPVDFEHRRLVLDDLHNLLPDNGDDSTGPDTLLENITDGRLKLFTTWRTLLYRRNHSDLFENGNYLPLRIQGVYSNHLFAFSRSFGGSTCIVAAPRLVAGLFNKEAGSFPLGKKVWKDTSLVLPEGLAGRFRNIFTGEETTASGTEEKTVPAAQIFSSFPVVLLENI